MKEIFDIEKFNIFSDEENYYFFRALNMGDNSDVEKEITTDIDGNVIRVRVDRKRFLGNPRYKEDSIVSLEETFDHIKMHNSKETNCISLTSNANAAIDYGRGYYKDKYVIVKVPKKEFGKTVYNAGLYMLEEINSKINELVVSGNIDSNTVLYLNQIDDINDLNELKNIIDSFKETTTSNDMFKRGINYIKPETAEVLYQTLDEKQNLEKNKLVAKLYILNRNLYKNIGNRLLLQTIGNAFSSMELIHYNDISKDEIIDVSKETVDMLALLQQLPKDDVKVVNLKNELLHFIVAGKTIDFGEYKYQDYNINDEITIEDMFNMTNGFIDYFNASNIYKKSFYLAKSKLRAKHIASELHKVTLNEDTYNNLINYISNNCYGIEPQIISRQNNKGYNISESVNLDINSSEIELLNEISKFSDSVLSYIVEHPKNALSHFFSTLSYLPKNPVDKMTYYANAIIDMFDWETLGIDSFTPSQRNEIIEKLKEKDCVSVYEYLKKMNVKEKDVARIIFVMIVKNKELSDIGSSETISADELEHYLGYYEIKGTKLELRKYQTKIVKKINKTFETKKFTSAILPTGGGKSFIALSEMLRYKDKHILYLAPNDEILNQIKRYIIHFVHGTKGSLGTRNTDKIIKETFPNLRLVTYNALSNSNESESIIKHYYDFIIFDELHRTGAEEWSKKIDELLEYQNDNVKVLGITATPVRDVDGIDMSDALALKLGYTEREIKKEKHLSSNMTLIEAIKLGIVVNPKVVSCEYTLTKDGATEKMLEQISDTKDEDKRNQLLEQFDDLRKKLENAQGISEILNTYLKPGGRYIVFLPVTKKDDGTYEDEDGNAISNKKAEAIIKSYQNQMRQYIFIEKYLKNNTILNDIYNNILSGIELSFDDINWLNNQKENILLLTKMKNIKDSAVLTTKQNDMADLIIKTMGWQYLDDSTKGKLLSEKVKDYVNSYSMLGSYGKNKNNKELVNFESDDSDKFKFMFVMNKLNEGTHVSNIDGLIWFRPLDENSYILYMQQLGRIIYSIDSEEEYPDEKRPIAIDLTNNTLRVGMNKMKKEKESDIILLQTVIDWMLEHNDIIPDINSSNSKESRYASILKRIQDKYGIYLNEDEFNKLSEKEKNEIQEIIKLGSIIGLWNITFDKRIDNKITEEYKDGLEELFELTPILRDFYDLKKQTDESVKKDWIPEFIEFINEGKVPYGKEAKVTNIGNSTISSKWNNHKDKIIKRFDTDPKYQTQKYDVARNIFHPIEIDWIPEFIEFINEGYPPTGNEAKERRIENSTIANKWNTKISREKITERFDADLRYQTQKYDVARSIIHPIDWIPEFIEFINEGNTPGSNHAKIRKIGDSTIKAKWAINKDAIIKRFDTDPKYQTQKYDVARNIFHPIEVDWIPEFIEFINEGNSPSGKEAKIRKISNSTAANKWKIDDNKEAIIKRFDTDPKYQTQKYDVARNIFHPIEIDWISEFIEFINEGHTPRGNEAKERRIENAIAITKWNNNKDEIIKRFDTDPKYQTQKYDVARNIFHPIEIDWIPEFIEFINEGNTPSSNAANEKKINNVIVRYKWNNNKDEIIKRFDTDPKYQTQKYDVARNIFHPKEIDWIPEFIEFINEGNTPSSIVARKKKIDNTTVPYKWRYSKDEIIKRFDTDPKYRTQKYDVARNIFYPKEIDWIPEFIEFINKGNLPTGKEARKKEIGNSTVRYKWSNESNREKIIRRFDTDSKYQTSEYDVARAYFDDYKMSSKNYVDSEENSYDKKCDSNNIKNKTVQ